MSPKPNTPTLWDALLDPLAKHGWRRALLGEPSTNLSIWCYLLVVNGAPRAGHKRLRARTPGEPPKLNGQFGATEWSSRGTPFAGYGLLRAHTLDDHPKPNGQFGVTSWSSTGAPLPGTNSYAHAPLTTPKLNGQCVLQVGRKVAHPSIQEAPL